MSGHATRRRSLPSSGRIPGSTTSATSPGTRARAAGCCFRSSATTRSLPTAATRRAGRHRRGRSPDAGLARTAFTRSQPGGDASACTAHASSTSSPRERWSQPVGCVNSTGPLSDALGLPARDAHPACMSWHIRVPTPVRGRLSPRRRSEAGPGRARRRRKGSGAASRNTRDPRIDRLFATLEPPDVLLNFARRTPAGVRSAARAFVGGPACESRLGDVAGNCCFLRSATR